MKLLILTGMSGAGKNTAFKMLEDMGYYCVDNLPVQLLKSFVELADSGTFEKKIVVGIDVRNGTAMKLLPDILQELDGAEKRFSILFLDAEDDVLVKRYKETRRNHPLSGRERIAAGIKEERQSIGFLRDEADYVIDTTHLLTRELKEELKKIFVEDAEYKSLFVTIISFGFKYGIPEDADLVFDVRFLPNPYYDLELRPFTGNDQPIKDFVLKYDEAKTFLDKTTDLIKFLIPNYIKEGKNQLVIAVGCTGGKHRSVCLADEIFEALNGDESYGLKIEHRDIGKDALRGK
ncbi:RNase adapter RapZ [Pseudobutyrivibrio xylanivorans]|uniref:RNase adapter RapZ n=1 Tax=Pseudobutyrivibrio xylanivorans TaxID=185007 RepID=A0A5P6VPX9_PSEXY|nr:RNase adapter RapZ [Pseudobutyrivibrio xylanivorans]QFJ54726.1 RNase adapter RapZ [Pseudobutyrivibrio xylanivorans]